MGERWHEFDYEKYAETGPRDEITGLRFDGAVMVRVDSGEEFIAYFYTRLMGGFGQEIGHVTHWRHIYEMDCTRLRLIEQRARAVDDTVMLANSGYEILNRESFVDAARALRQALAGGG